VIAAEFDLDREQFANHVGVAGEFREALNVLFNANSPVSLELPQKIDANECRKGEATAGALRRQIGVENGPLAVLPSILESMDKIPQPGRFVAARVISF
jgi:hypothetical protein